jgi:hypothetical protein
LPGGRPGRKKKCIQATPLESDSDARRIRKGLPESSAFQEIDLGVSEYPLQFWEFIEFTRGQAGALKQSIYGWKIEEGCGRGGGQRRRQEQAPGEAEADEEPKRIPLLAHARAPLCTPTHKVNLGG